MNIHTLNSYANKIIDVRNLGQLCQVIGMDINQLKLQSINKHYIEYIKQERIDKFRLIEFPDQPLMRLQRQFNVYLQSAYYLHQTAAAYGFVINIKGEKKAKNILSNARQHLGHPYMLKVDMKDFFHQISKQRVYQIFKNKPFRYNSTSSQILANLFTYKERLPMGAPTSPVLSNFATIELDRHLSAWAEQRHTTYTRFADDLTFSNATDSFSEGHLQEIRNICHQNNYLLNETKSIIYSANDEKKVTGLLVHDTIDIEQSFYDDLSKDLKRLKYMVEAAIIVKQNQDNEIVRKYKQEVRGKINFIGMIEGYRSPQYVEYSKKMEEALHPIEEQLFNRWTHFNYF